MLSIRIKSLSHWGKLETEENFRAELGIAQPVAHIQASQQKIHGFLYEFMPFLCLSYVYLYYSFIKFMNFVLRFLKFQAMLPNRCWYCRTSLQHEKAAPCLRHTEKLFCPTLIRASLLLFRHCLIKNQI